ncbi:SDR family NAD(P)-dependent oxidoreductase [Actinoplanes sp. NPDC048988]|uniref:SDR family NAD(P)-dependent oxidoreductase n=1 Tax=Actinoplanes sp. NPDC048988 TaxID=3363901 RepID=UPI00371174C2
MSIWLVTGASRGLGHHIALAAASAGHTVLAGVRDTDRPYPALLEAGVRVVRLDVSSPGDVAAVAGLAEREFGRLDVLVNNAGYGLFGALELTGDDEIRSLLEVNVLGLIRATRAVLPMMRRQRSGRIVNIGSVGGFTAVPGSGAYSVSKFAVEAVTEALNVELDGLGVRATVVEPGQFRTDFLDPSSARTTERPLIEDYQATVGTRLRALRAADGRQPGDPAKAAAAVVTIADAADPPVRVQLGRDALDRVEQKLLAVGAEMSRWRSLSESTGF